MKQDPVALAQAFSGNHIIPGSEPISTAYAGHQFGTFVPQLGDGRAHLLGGVTLVERFLRVLRSPYDELEQTSGYQDPPPDGDVNYKTFCGT